MEHKTSDRNLTWEGNRFCMCSETIVTYLKTGMWPAKIKIEGYFSKEHDRKPNYTCYYVCMRKQAEVCSSNFMDGVGVSDLNLSTQLFTSVKSKPLREMKYREWWEPKGHVN